MKCLTPFFVEGVGQKRVYKRLNPMLEAGEAVFFIYRAPIPSEEERLECQLHKWIVRNGDFCFQKFLQIYYRIRSGGNAKYRHLQRLA